jgi:hypothetical protein
VAFSRSARRLSFDEPVQDDSASQLHRGSPSNTSQNGAKNHDRDGGQLDKPQRCAKERRIYERTINKLSDPTSSAYGKSNGQNKPPAPMHSKGIGLGQGASQVLPQPEQHWQILRSTPGGSTPETLKTSSMSPANDHRFSRGVF